VEEVEQRLSKLDAELRGIALQSLEGWTNQEIAEKKGCVERTVERKLERIRAAWADAAA
jgi:DNA-directed RNA polymerase specialized sigma24 family protein